MSKKQKAQEIRALFSSEENNISNYNFTVGELVRGKIMSHYAKLNDVITNTETGHVLLRFCVKGHSIDLMFKPEDVVVQSSIIESDNPICFDSIEQAFKTIAEETEKKSI